jgi:hypothetical protein
MCPQIVLIVYKRAVQDFIIKFPQKIKGNNVVIPSQEDAETS